MAFKRIDLDEDAEYEGFSYYNCDGYEEHVKFGEDIVLYIGDDDAEYPVYVDDVPKLIKALQAAYDFKKGEA